MKIAICYYSRHHGNTYKVVKAMAEENGADLIDVTARALVRLEQYDAVGFASGIYYSKFHQTVADFARQYLPPDKKVFFIYSCGAMRKNYTKTIAEAVRDKNAQILGEYGCRGFDTFGPFRLIGGIAKGHPDAADLQGAKEFYRSVCRKL